MIAKKNHLLLANHYQTGMEKKPLKHLAELYGQ